MSLVISSITTEEMRRNLRLIVNGNGTSTIEYLNLLRHESVDVLYDIIDEMEEKFGLKSEMNSKKEQTAREKCTRPSTKKKYPWFTLAHIRDYLRFRTHLTKASDFSDVLRYFLELRDKGVIDFVKVDVDKLSQPSLFGWRMISTDLRILESGLIVEHYMTFGDMISVNEAWLHKVYEKWRSQSPDNMTIKQLEHFQRDARFSSHAYRELLYDGVLIGSPNSVKLMRQRRDSGDMILGSLKSTLGLP